MGSLFGIKINKSLDPFSGSYGESKSLGTTGPQLDPSKMSSDDWAAAVLSGGGIPGAMDKGLREKYSWKGLYDQEIAKGKSESEARDVARAKMAALEARRPKTKAQEGVIDYTKLQKTLKQMQGVKGKAVSPDIMKSLLSGAVEGQIQPAIAREERAMDRAIQKERTDIAAEQHKQALKEEKRTQEVGFIGDEMQLQSYAQSLIGKGYLISKL
jgi:hypothetical protein